jgi:hypothetical protein
MQEPTYTARQRRNMPPLVRLEKPRIHYSNTDGITDQAKLDQRNRKVAAIKGRQAQLAAMSREGIK